MTLNVRPEPTRGRADRPATDPVRHAPRSNGKNFTRRAHGRARHGAASRAVRDAGVVPAHRAEHADYFADYLAVPRRQWDLSADARSRWSMLLPWAVGFVIYQLINPGYVSWWASAWSSFGHDIGFTPASWMSASILSFCAAGIMTLLVRGTARLLQQ
jgi:hypothetical protein